MFGEVVVLFEAVSLEDIWEANVLELHSPNLEVHVNFICNLVINHKPIFLCDGPKGVDSRVHELR